VVLDTLGINQTYERWYDAEMLARNLKDSALINFRPRKGLSEVDPV